MPRSENGPALSQSRRETSLWQRARDGDAEAADELVRETYRQVFAWLYKLTGDSDLAADLTQETYRKAWPALGGFRGGCRITSWLCRIAHTTFLNHVRRPRALLPLDDEQAAAVRDPARSPEDAMVAAIEGERLRRAVMGLSEPLGFAIAARYWAELPVKEIAELQGISPLGVRKRLKKALARLAVALEDEV
ncbi:MAG: sigma-70 family RNA polymerase sigma factor [Acidobacteriota bacterium]|nr:sigma-70 family RNA polymerase sigma factor [Acidobacteriota bacterium]